MTRRCHLDPQMDRDVNSKLRRERGHAHHPRESDAARPGDLRVVLPRWLVGVMCSPVFVVSAGEMHLESYVATLITQRVPDRTRGRLTGVLTTSRHLLQVGGVALATHTQALYNTSSLVRVLCLLAVVS